MSAIEPIGTGRRVVRISPVAPASPSEKEQDGTDGRRRPLPQEPRASKEATEKGAGGRIDVTA